MTLEKLEEIVAENKLALSRDFGGPLRAVYAQQSGKEEGLVFDGHPGGLFNFGIVPLGEPAVGANKIEEEGNRVFHGSVLTAS